MRNTGRRLLSTLACSTLLLAVASISTPLSAQGQTGTVTGTVVGDGGRALSGAQVLLVGTGLGTRAGENGRYTIVNVPAGEYRVRAAMLGHRPIEQPATVVAGQSVTRDFTMKAEALGLDALVITGTAGAARQREVGNSISQLDMSRVQESPSNVGSLLQGKVAGMTVMPSSAMAGSGSMIRLRGNVSVAVSNQPLIYVDGVRLRSDGYQRNVPFTGSDLRSGNDIASPLNDINPSDIERIEVIKGAAAATLYGTEAAAGVIQIFTKGGHSGRPEWTFEVDQGFARSLKFGPDPEDAPPGDTIFSCATIVAPIGCQGTIAGLSRQLPEQVPRTAHAWHLARGRHVELPLHRSVAAKRLSAALLHVGRRWWRSAPVLRVGLDVRRRRCPAERQRGEERLSRKLLVHADRQPALQLEHGVHERQDLEHRGRKQRPRNDAQRVPSRPQLRLERPSRNHGQAAGPGDHERSSIT